MSGEQTRKPIRVLNVNGRDIARSGNEEVLKREGFEPVSAGTGKEALAAASSGDLEVALVDVDLPDLNGVEVCAKLKSDPKTAGMIVLLTSATFVTSRNKISGLDSGADGYLVHPYESAELFATLRSLLRGREAEKRAQALAQALREAMDVRDEFLAMLGHELRNPLAAMTTALHVLNVKRDPATIDRYLQLLTRQAHSLERIIADLLDVARITRGKVSLDKVNLDLREVAQRCVLALSDELRNSGHQLKLSVPDDEVRVLGDQVRLEQVMSNLVTNAIKYTPKGGHLSVRLEQGDGRARLEVSDDGIGMTEAMRAQVFDLFVQAKQSLDRSRGGLGLGLTVVRQLVEMHEGQVSVESEGEGKGSRFIVDLPLAVEEARPAKATPRPKFTPPPPERGLRVLVVEDNEDARNTLQEALALFKHEVITAADGLEGLKLVVSQKPQVALVDIGLPRLDGYEVARLAREELAGDCPHLIAMTGYGQPDDRERALKAGFNLHIVKPVALPELLALLETIANPPRPPRDEEMLQALSGK
jgi:signal transduction histidine kinase